MRLLLDTNVLLWAFTARHRLGPKILDLLEDTANEVLFSAVSLWEIAIKAGLGRNDFLFDPQLVLQTAVEAGFIELPVHAAIAIRVATLPRHHSDPFDRLLIAQAMSGPMRLYTSDRFLAVYSELVTIVP